MKTFWLASYPKSGNTWFRILVANLSAGEEPADINNLPERSGIASARGPFDHLLLIESGLLTDDEIDRLRPRVYEELASGAEDEEYDEHDRTSAPVRLVKVHDAYTLTSAGEPLLAGADGAVVIVRDPRDVAASFAHHNRTPIDKAIATLNDPKPAVAETADRQHRQFRQTLLGWSEHVASWLDQRDLPVHLVRYEDLKADTAGALARALAFAGWPATAEQIARAVRFADFGILKAQERDKGFREIPRPGKGGPFFRRGEAGGWRDELTAPQIARIEARHVAMMRRLGYDPVGKAEG